MILICAWCQKVLGYSEPLEKRSLSHGICEPCAVKLVQSYRSGRIPIYGRKEKKKDWAGRISTKTINRAEESH